MHGITCLNLLLLGGPTGEEEILTISIFGLTRTRGWNLPDQTNGLLLSYLERHRYSHSTYWPMTMCVLNSKSLILTLDLLSNHPWQKKVNFLRCPTESAYPRWLTGLDYRDGSLICLWQYRGGRLSASFGCYRQYTTDHYAVVEEPSSALHHG
jgi:hypothetical protein